MLKTVALLAAGGAGGSTQCDHSHGSGIEARDQVLLCWQLANVFG